MSQMPSIASLPLVEMTVTGLRLAKRSFPKTTQMAKPQEPFRGVIFDLDGTLLDTEGISERAIHKTVQVFGKAHSTALHKTFLGRPSQEWTQMAIDALDLHGLITPKDVALNWEAHMHEMMPEVQALPGALELLRTLAERKVPLALATSSSAAAVAVKRKHHEELFSYFQVIVTGDDPLVKRGKPQPDIFLLAAERLLGPLPPAEEPLNCIVFEDSAMGVTAGKAAHAYAVAVPDPRIYPTAEERAELFHHADAVITSLTEFDPSAYGL